MSILRDRYPSKLKVEEPRIKAKHLPEGWRFLTSSRLLEKKPARSKGWQSLISPDSLRLRQTGPPDADFNV